MAEDKRLDMISALKEVGIDCFRAGADENKE